MKKINTAAQNNVVPFLPADNCIDAQPDELPAVITADTLTVAGRTFTAVWSVTPLKTVIALALAPAAL